MDAAKIIRLSKGRLIFFNINVVVNVAAIHNVREGHVRPICLLRIRMYVIIFIDLVLILLKVRLSLNTGQEENYVRLFEEV